MKYMKDIMDYGLALFCAEESPSILDLHERDYKDWWGKDYPHYRLDEKIRWELRDNPIFFIRQNRLVMRDHEKSCGINTSSVQNKASLS